MQGAGERNGLAHMVQAADPRDGALDAHAEARVRHAAVAAQVEVPLEGFLGQLVLSMREFNNSKLETRCEPPMISP
jgi:hypothetical protein